MCVEIHSYQASKILRCFKEGSCNYVRESNHTMIRKFRDQFGKKS